MCFIKHVGLFKIPVAILLLLKEQLEQWLEFVKLLP